MKVYGGAILEEGEVGGRHVYSTDLYCRQGHICYRDKSRLAAKPAFLDARDWPSNDVTEVE